MKIERKSIPACDVAHVIDAALRLGEGWQTSGPPYQRQNATWLDLWRWTDETPTERTIMTDNPEREDMASQGQPITFTYTNWRGETAQRTAVPKAIWFGSTDWHPEPGWLMTAYDLAKMADRDFALADCAFCTPAAPAAYQIREMTAVEQAGLKSLMTESRGSLIVPAQMSVEEAARVLLANWSPVFDHMSNLDTEAQEIANRIAGPRGEPNECPDGVQVLDDAEAIMKATLRALLQQEEGTARSA